MLGTNTDRSGDRGDRNRPNWSGGNRGVRRCDDEAERENQAESENLHFVYFLLIGLAGLFVVTSSIRIPTTLRNFILEVFR